MGLQFDMGIDSEGGASPRIVAAEMLNFGRKIRSFREPLQRSVKKVVAPSIRKNFEAGGRPDAWDELSDATLEWREYKGISGSAPLIASGRLEQVASQLNIWEYTSDTAQIGELPNDVFYGAIQDAGATFHAKTKDPKKSGIGTIPERPFFMLQDEDVDDIEDVFTDWIYERLFEEGGFRPSLPGIFF